MSINMPTFVITRSSKIGKDTPIYIKYVANRSFNFTYDVINIPRTAAAVIIRGITLIEPNA